MGGTPARWLCVQWLAHFVVKYAPMSCGRLVNYSASLGWVSCQRRAGSGGNLCTGAARELEYPAYVRTVTCTAWYCVHQWHSSERSSQQGPVPLRRTEHFVSAAADKS